MENNETPIEQPLEPIQAENTQETPAETESVVTDNVEVAPAAAVEQPPPVIDPRALHQDVYIPAEKPLSDDTEFGKAKAFLSSISGKNGENVYSHLTTIVMKLLETRATNAYDLFENISAETKRLQLPISTAEIRESKSQKNNHLKELLDLFVNEKESGEEQGQMPDFMELSRLLEWAGISLGTEDTYLLTLSMRKIVKEKKLLSIRFWGKIFGLKKNYYIVEAEESESPAEEEAQKEEEKKESTEEGEHDALPKPKTKPQPKLTKEVKSGVNKYAYYVCHSAGGSWIRLPDVHPEKLQISRHIYKHLTGDLKHEIHSYPPFNDNEAQYLRCQIARIAASTTISPINYYVTDPEDEGGDEEGQVKNVILNAEYEKTTNDALLNLDNWVHHIPYILPQGRTVWQNPYPKPEDEENGDDNEEKDEEKEPEEEINVEPEHGPSILAPLSSDEDYDGQKPWTVFPCSQYLETKFSPVVLRSVRWPGAYTVSSNDKFINVYFGNGLKDLGTLQKFDLPALPAIQKEYGQDNNPATLDHIKEQSDPTVEEERVHEEKLQEKAEEKAAEEEAADEPAEDN